METCGALLEKRIRIISYFQSLNGESTSLSELLEKSATSLREVLLSVPKLAKQTKRINGKAAAMGEHGMKGQMAVWIAVGTGVGVAIGVARHSMPIWICIGVAVGAIVGAFSGANKRR